MAFYATYRNRKGCTVGTKRDRKTNSDDKVIHASTANHYNSDRLGRVHATAQSKCSLKVCDWKINFWIRHFTFWFALQNLIFMHA